MGSVVDPDVLNRFVSDVVNVFDVAAAVNELSPIKAKLPTGDSPVGRTYCRLNAEERLQTSGMSSCSAPMSTIFLGM